MIDKFEILAMTTSDLSKVLEDNGLLEFLEQGQIRCPITDERIDWENLGLVKIENGSPVLYSVNAEPFVEEMKATG